MKEINPDIAILISQAEDTIEIIDQNRQFYNSFMKNEFVMLGRTTVSAMVLSQIFVDFYTCVETFLFRVSQEFENSLKKEKWHKELLHTMTLQIHDIRPAVLSSSTSQILHEILLFRHFRRYYYDHHYDWEKLELIEKKYLQVYPLLISDIKRFIEYLKEIVK